MAVLSLLSILLAFIWTGASIVGFIELCIVFGILGFINMLLMKWAHNASLFEAKRRGLRRREEGKMHGGVLFVYAFVNGVFTIMITLGETLPENVTTIAYFVAVAICSFMILIAGCKRARYARIEKREDREIQKEVEIYEQSLMQYEEDDIDYEEDSYDYE